MYGEDACNEILSTFNCPLNIDVQDFIQHKAIDFAKKHISITFLVFSKIEEGTVLAGYYTLANKFVAVSSELLSKTLQKRIAKFSQYDDVLKQYYISMPLIAQLGKNFTENALKSNISGNSLLELAFQKITLVQSTIGGNTTYIDCAATPEL